MGSKIIQAEACELRTWFDGWEALEVIAKVKCVNVGPAVGRRPDFSLYCPNCGLDDL